MQYTHELTLRRRITVPFAKFLANDALLQRKAAEQHMSAVDTVAAAFIPEALVDETYPDWILRQVKEILETELLHDEMGWLKATNPSRCSQRVRSVQITENDLPVLMKTFGEHPDVVRCADQIFLKRTTNAA